MPNSSPLKAVNLSMCLHSKQVTKILTALPPKSCPQDHTSLRGQRRNSLIHSVMHNLWFTGSQCWVW